MHGGAARYSFRTKFGGPVGRFGDEQCVDWANVHCISGHNPFTTEMAKTLKSTQDRRYRCGDATDGPTIWADLGKQNGRRREEQLFAKDARCYSENERRFEEER